MKKANLLLLIVLLFACSKKSDPTPSSTSTTDYLPTTSGNTWTYTGDIQYSLKMTGNSKTIDTKSYLEVQQTYNGATTLGYVRKENGVYYDRGAVAYGTSTADLELIILKDNVAVGTSWSQNVTFSGIPTTYTFTIAAKDISYTVLTKTYDKVIKVKLETTIPLISTDPIATEYLYFAYGVGLIQTSADAVTINLSSYTVK